MSNLTRRNFLAVTAASLAAGALAGCHSNPSPATQPSATNPPSPSAPSAAWSNTPVPPVKTETIGPENQRLHTDLPLVDYHVHLDQLGVDNAVAIAAARKMKFGLVEHAGSRIHKYPVVLSTDGDLDKWIRKLENKPVYKGVQAEGCDWAKCFSKEAIARLDYVLTDAMTIPQPDGRLSHIWKPEEVQIDNADKWMDRYVDFHVEIMATEPFDILANTTFMPDALLKQYDLLWTEARMKKVIDAAVKYKIALEISAKYKLPSLAFLKLARSAGCKFSFGTNARGPEMGALDYSVQMAKAIGLTAADLFVPAPKGSKPIETRKI